ncbi:hypothetical protein HFX_4123 (plasmid) [Haloferax mediterranei ATCC 33500]|uniref:Uncharacterized protein n=1 Tax=Haloferax mediterranei (strain ATCC 33500 / DSM 1411 / JCM 8866 / NBRC 14739 / NCIMB 2177 / R-4) TaxID=523841 RepID=I3R9A4_HALMT|nr:hypothetical protein HFX_4123 [Haloferax mediterranei ATCC 33500]
MEPLWHVLDDSQPPLYRVVDRVLANIDEGFIYRIDQSLAETAITKCVIRDNEMHDGQTAPQNHSVRSGT